MMFALKKHNFFLKYKYCALRTSMTKPKYTIYWMQQNTAFWCLFDFTIKEVDSTNITLEHSLLKATSKKFGEEKA